MHQHQVTLEISPGKPRTVTFDFGRLCAIEEAVDKNVNEIFSGQLPDYFIAGVRTAEELQPEQMLDLAKRWNVRFMARFVAACLDEKLEALHTAVPVSRLVAVFYELVGGFMDAVKALNTGKDEDEAGPSTASPAAGPGPGSSSNSTPSV